MMGVSERSEDGGELKRGTGGELKNREQKEFAIILLAAGPSSRMGQSKQKLPIDEKPLLTYSAETALKSKVGKVIIVLGSDEGAHRKLLKSLPVEIVFNSHWQAGMGSSLKAGLLHVLSNNPNTEAVIIMVCDQPLLKQPHLQLLVETYRRTKARVVASAYSHTLGVPALFNQQLFDEILKLGDDQGAKKIIQQHSAETVDFPGGFIDLDTPEEYKNFLEEHSKKMP